LPGNPRYAIAPGMKKSWRLKPVDPQQVLEIRQRLGCSRMLARILATRPIGSGAAEGIQAPLARLRPPFAIRDMDAAVDRIFQALIQRQRMLIFGDYDVDGVTATTLVWEFLKAAGADVGYYIPHRTAEGYGLKAVHIPQVAVSGGIHVIITVDCGSSSHEAVATANASGIDVIITDHHQITAPFPEAVAVVNPCRQDCEAGFHDLAGVGVAFCLIAALRSRLRDHGFWPPGREPNLKTACDLVALGTIADMVPLVDDNRILTKAGLEVLQTGAREGIRALMETCGIDANTADAADIAFRLAPRINAAGRIDHAHRAVELLTTQSKDHAREIARRLDHLNQQRQVTETQILEAIGQHLTRHPELLEKKSIVLADAAWHPGVLGIVAAKIAAMWFKPVVLIGTGNGMGKGSARSIPGFDLYQGLCACAEQLEGFGGHAMAAGLSIRHDRIESFSRRFETTVTAMTAGHDRLPTLWIDTELAFDAITERFIDEVQSLQPFGAGNPEPVFVAENVSVPWSKAVGQTHRRMTLVQANGDCQRRLSAIWFHIGAQHAECRHFSKIAFRLQWNHWNGKRSAQLLIEDAQA
jgi:single-stranded-DNA-specific exonuclease